MIRKYMRIPGINKKIRAKAPKTGGTTMKKQLRVLAELAA